MRVLLAHEGREHRKQAMYALQNGMSQCGIDATVTGTWYQGEFDVVVGWNHCPIEHPRTLLLEAGYVNGDMADYTEGRLRFISTSWNQLHGKSDGFTRPRPSDRWDALNIDMKPWRTEGEYALIMDQHPGDSMSPPENHWREIAESLQSRIQVHVRPHPLIDTNKQRSSLLDELVMASCAVTWSSTAAIESVINGVPTIAFSEYCIAYPVCSHDLSQSLYVGERDQWAYDLAYRQWTLDELRSGEAWEHLWPADYETN